MKIFLSNKEIENYASLREELNNTGKEVAKLFGAGEGKEDILEETRLAKVITKEKVEDGVLFEVNTEYLADMFNLYKHILPHIVKCVKPFVDMCNDIGMKSAELASKWYL